jgi:hypothetical protein
MTVKSRTGNGGSELFFKKPVDGNIRPKRLLRFDCNGGFDDLFSDTPAFTLITPFLPAQGIESPGPVR